MQWSYEQLAPQEQRLLRLMSVFAGGWTLQAAAYVAQAADEYEALALLTALHDKSLLVVDGDTAAGRPRYRMLETVRQFALDRLDECDEGEGARGRHVAHLVALAEEAAQHWYGPDQDRWIHRFRQEHENLIAGLTWCSGNPGDSASGLRLVAATTFYWVWNGVEQGHRLASAALEHDHASVGTAARVGALCAIAKLSLFRGRYDESLSHAQEALALARRIGEVQPLVMALDVAGAALNTLGRTDEAVPLHEEGLELARQLGDPGLVLRRLNSIAEARRAAGQLDEAERHYREALELSRTRSDRLGVVVVLNNLIRVLVASGRPGQALSFAADCLGLVHQQKVGVDLLEACVGLASSLGQYERAARYWGAADQKLKEWGYRHQPVDIDHSAPLIAKARRALGDAAFDAIEAAGRTLDLEAALLDVAQWLEREQGTDPCRKSDCQG
jgi:non-specific serine/threonine protein kinase